MFIFTPRFKLTPSKVPADNFTKWLVAASIVVLVTLNTTILSQKRNENKNNTGIAEIVKTVNNQLY